MKTTFWTRCERFPPVLVRLLARHKHGPPLTDGEIAQASGLPIHQVACISASTDWRGIDLPTARQFTVACGVDFTNAKDMERVESYMRMRPTWKYLRKDKAWATFYQPLIHMLKGAMLKRNLERKVTQG